MFSPDPINWIYSKPQPASQGTFNLNNNGEQIFFMSGGNVGGPNATIAASDGGTYTGNFLFGFNTKGNVWTPVCGNVNAGGTQNSDKPINLDCFLTWPTAQADLNKYSGLMTPTTKRDWIERINNPSNWTGYVDNATYEAGPNFYGQSITINAGGFTDGIWIGSSSNNWFECGNWQSLKVPDENVNVILDSNSVQKVNIDSTAPFSDLYADIAKCRNLSVSNFSVELLSDINNVLYVYGDLSISGVGSINMNDGNSSTNDGIIKLFGNWTNNIGTTAFLEGNGTINFVGSSTQVVNSNIHSNIETFSNVILDNDFNTALSNNLIATGNLELKTNKLLSINPNDYTIVGKKFTNYGDVLISNNGQFIQIDEVDNNDGDYTGTKFQVQRTAQVKNLDYVYWSAPTAGFSLSSLPTNNRYEWSTLNPNSNGTVGNWIAPSTATMTKGRGYIARASNGAIIPTALTTTFTGQPHNGQFSYQIYRGNYSGVDYDADLTNPNNLLTTAYDDNWNLVGNPYPSAIDAMEFINLNTATNNVKMVGAIWVWKHEFNPTSSISPFYQSFAYNYSSNDYIKFNAMGSSEPTLFTNGKIASGQGFMINMSDELSPGVPNPSGNSIIFNNDLRTGTSNAIYDNTDFFRSSNATVQQTEERHRIWLDLINTTSGQLDRNLLGYATNATLGYDNLYDCFTKPKAEIGFYSLIDNMSYAIQGRPLPFDSNDVVPMGINIVQSGNHLIAINTVDGLFAQNQNIYLEDKQLNIIHDLRQAPYNFTSSVGTFNDRFVIRYTTAALSNQNFESIDSSVLVSTNDEQINIKSINDSLSEVSVYDVLGREIIKKTTIASSDLILNNIRARNQALIVKIKLENGEVVTRKVVL